MTDDEVEVSPLAINVTVPAALRWRDVRRGEEFELTTLNVRMLPDGHLAVKAYGRPAAGGRGAYVAFRVPERAELTALVAAAGPASIDAKRRRALGPAAWDRFAGQTSILPFAAILAGRTSARPRELGWRAAAGVLAYALMLGGHAHLIGVSPFPS